MVVLFSTCVSTIHCHVSSPALNAACSVSLLKEVTHVEMRETIDTYTVYTFIVLNVMEP